MTRISSHIVLSTEHLDPKTSEALESKGPDSDAGHSFGDWRDDIVVCEVAWGHWVKVTTPNPDGKQSIEERMAAFPADLQDCLRRAQSFGASWILFDRDEPTIDLTQHHW